MAEFKIKSTTEGGLLAAITVIMGLIAVYMPILGTIATLLWPMPIIILVVRHGLKSGVISIIAATIIMAALISPLNAIHLVATFGPPSLALGYGFQKNWPAAKILLTGFGAAILGVAVSSVLLLAISGINPFDMETQVGAMEEALQEAISMYETMGMSPEQLAQLQEQFTMIFKLMGMLMPLAVISAGLLTTWINFAAGGKVLRRLGYQVASLPPFDEWRRPKLLLYVFGFSLVGLYWGSSRSIDWLYQLSLNANLLATFGGFLQGIAVLSNLLRERVSRFVFWLILIFIFFNGTFSQILAFIGLFDMIFDYRKRFQKRKDTL